MNQAIYNALVTQGIEAESAGLLATAERCYREALAECDSETQQSEVLARIEAVLERRHRRRLARRAYPLMA